ncbi:hypothetical protein Leryth_018538, partial [Lithospermum erythrorhizon]
MDPFLDCFQNLLLNPNLPFNSSLIFSLLHTCILILNFHMMQFTESLPSPVGYQISSFSNITMTKDNQTIQRSTPTRPFLDFPTSKVALGHNNSSSSLGDANCMEQLLVHCANAIESNDATLTQQILWVLNNIATPDGDSINALLLRLSYTNISINTTNSPSSTAGYVDLTPWHRLGSQRNVLLKEFLMASHPVKLTVVGATEGSFHPSRNIIVEFRVIPSSPSDGFSTLIEQVRMQHIEQSYHQREALIINCHMMLHYIPEETLPTFSMENCSRMSYRTMFLKSIRSLDPTLVVLVDEDADFTSNNLVGRLRSAFNYLWIPYDTVDTFLPKGSMQRQWYEADICWKIENVLAHEGVQRVERLENKSKWVQRMRNADFKGVGFSEDAVLEVKNMLDEHAAGWGMKKDEDEL